MNNQKNHLRFTYVLENYDFFTVQFTGWLAELLIFCLNWPKLQLILPVFQLILVKFN